MTLKLLLLLLLFTSRLFLSVDSDSILDTIPVSLSLFGS